jgi:hypothetical protein
VELPSLDRYSLVLPLRLLEEVKKLPPAIASNSYALQDVSSLLLLLLLLLLPDDQRRKRREMLETDT